MNSEVIIDRTAGITTAASGISRERKRRILLADDSPQIRESLSKLLRIAGYHVVSAANGSQTLDRALTEDFDLLLLDLNMPGIDGWEAFEKLAALKPTLPVIIITAQPDQRQWAILEGAKALMEKPFNPGRLLELIEELLQVPSKKAEKNEFEERFSFRASEKRVMPFFSNRRDWQRD
jgi:CheY-like chemotaxis protein